MFAMRDEFRTGIQQIDMEHERLFGIADQAYEVLMDEFITDKYDYIVNILSELKDYAVTHFKNEEEYMASIRYKKLFSHKAEHNEFLEKVSEYDLGTVDNHQKEVMLELLVFLNDWLIHHIMENDKLIGK